MADADWAAEMAERERAALIARHRARRPPPAPRTAPEPPRPDRVMDREEAP